MTIRAALLVTALASALLLTACDGCDGGPGDPCAMETPPPGCGENCSGGQPCGPGLYCTESGECAADCTATTGCPDGEQCNGYGRCVPIEADGDADVDGDADSDADDICADVEVSATPVTPTVMLIIDQSASMTASFSGGRNRWNALRLSLLDRPDGLIHELQSRVRFGLALYSARSRDGNDGGPPIGECPMLTTVTPALDNYDAIDDVYLPDDVIEDTPTGDAIDAVIDLFFSTPDPSGDPVAFIVATDGEPDRCEELDPQNGQEEAIAAAERAYGQGIRTFIISVGEGVVSAAHLQDMANAGLGVGEGDPDAEYWEAGDDDGLTSALESIIGGELSCLIELNGELVLDIACDGAVFLNGRRIPCDDPNGWRAVDETHIELQGDACDELLTTPDATLSATFPCDAVILI